MLFPGLKCLNKLTVEISSVFLVQRCKAVEKKSPVKGYTAADFETVEARGEPAKQKHGMSSDSIEPQYQLMHTITINNE